jgi:hypothetical protein
MNEDLHTVFHFDQGKHPFHGSQETCKILPDLWQSVRHEPKQAKGGLSVFWLWLIYPRS